MQFTSRRKFRLSIKTFKVASTEEELKHRTKVKCDDFKLWLIQIGIFVLYVKLEVRTMFAQAQTVIRL